MEYVKYDEVLKKEEREWRQETLRNMIYLETRKGKSLQKENEKNNYKNGEE